MRRQGDHFTQRSLGRPQESSGEDWGGLDILNIVLEILHGSEREPSIPQLYPTVFPIEVEENIKLTVFSNSLL